MVHDPGNGLGRVVRIGIDEHEHAPPRLFSPMVPGACRARGRELHRPDPESAGIILEQPPGPVGALVIDHNDFGRAVVRGESLLVVRDGPQGGIQRPPETALLVSSRDDKGDRGCALVGSSTSRSRLTFMPCHSSGSQEMTRKPKRSKVDRSSSRVKCRHGTSGQGCGGMTPARRAAKKAIRPQTSSRRASQRYPQLPRYVDCTTSTCPAQMRRTSCNRDAGSVAYCRTKSSVAALYSAVAAGNRAPFQRVGPAPTQ